MNRLIFFLAIILLLIACKSKRDIIGIYNFKESGYEIIKLNADSTFQFEGNYIKKYNYDTHQSNNANQPHRFAASGTWRKIGHDTIVLNSLYNVQDTSNYWDILKQSGSPGKFKFSFKTIVGDTYYVYQITSDPELKKLVAMKPHGGLEYFEIDVSKFDTLYFNDGLQNLLYPVWSFVKGNNPPAHYVMTVKPPHIQGYFKDRILTVKNKRLILSKDSVYKKLSPAK